MNDNKTIKVLRILTLSLTLMLLVFALAKKVGLCAGESSSSSDYASSFPLRINPNYGLGELPSDFDYNQFMSAVLGACPWSPDVCAVNEVSPTYIDLQCFQFGNRAGFEVTSSSFGNFKWRFGVNATVMVRYTFSSGTAVVTNTYGSGNSSIGSTYTSLDSLPDSTQFVKQHTFIFLYPVYASTGSLSYNGITYFENWTPSGGDSGIDSPGFSDAFDDAYQDWIDGNYNPVDTNAPTNNTSTPAWLQSILNGLGTLNNTIGGGFATIFNKLKDFTSGVFDFFNDKVVPFFDGITEVTEDIKDILSGSLESDNDIYEAWVDGYEDSVFYDLSNIVSNCKNILTSIFNASTPSTLSFNIPTYPVNIPTTSGASNYVYLFGQSLTIDFSWYRSPIFGGRSIYDMVNSVFFTFLYVGFLAALFFKVPSLIHGASGFSRAMHGDYNQSMGNASGTPSNSKYDFAAMTQFILDN